MFFETSLTAERIDRRTAEGVYGDRLLNDFVRQRATEKPLDTAVVDARGRCSYAELRDMAEIAALAFLDAGIRRGDVVTVQLPNCIEYVIVALALERIGAVIHPVAPIFRQRELRGIVRLARSRAAVIPASFRGFSYPSMYRELRAEAPALRLAIVVGDGDAGGGMPWAEFLDRGASRARLRDDLDLFRPGPNEVIELMFTSGTTGEPKGVMHTANTIAAAVDPIVRMFGLSGDDVCHMASTLGHQTGFLYGMQLALRIRGRLVLQEAWDAAHFVKLVEAEHVTCTMGATPFLADTLAAPNLRHHDTASLRIFVCGGAPIPQPLAERAMRELSCRLVPVWGMTEVGIVTAVGLEDPAAKITASDGRPYAGAEVAVRDDDGRPAPAGTEGELYTRTPAMFAGYSQGRSFTQRFFDADGWFSTGDRATLDADGYLRITGRSKDLIIRGGENVPVKEVEDVLIRHPKVHNVALVAVPHSRLGEIGCACVVAAAGPPPSLEELRAFLDAQQVTRQFWPERLLVLDELPMTPSGKIQKFLLRELSAARAGEMQE
ncbi:MAG: AMP-binding protein [Deltaproteobacteria bacterium]|nr:AMP-binding protein [Deltaproteobacteria bacterium]